MKTNFNPTEIIIITIILGTFIATALGFLFAEDTYFSEGGSGIRWYTDNHSRFSAKRFNYVIGISSFIITSGIAYLTLNRLSKKQ